MPKQVFTRLQKKRVRVDPATLDKLDEHATLRDEMAELIESLDLSYLLLPPGKTAQIGSESGATRENGVSRFRSAQGSFRYVLYQDGKAVAALQVMARKPPRKGPWKAAIANVFTLPSHRRKGLAKKLLKRARSDFDEVSHSKHDLSSEGALWKSAVR